MMDADEGHEELMYGDYIVFKASTEEGGSKILGTYNNMSDKLRALDAQGKSISKKIDLFQNYVFRVMPPC